MYNIYKTRKLTNEEVNAIEDVFTYENDDRTFIYIKLHDIYMCIPYIGKTVNGYVNRKSLILCLNKYNYISCVSST